MVECSNDEELIRQRVEVAKNNTWRSKYEKIKTIIQEELEAKGINK
jgi:hypothetical protein